MKNKKIIIGILIIGVILVGGLWVWSSQIHPQTQKTCPTTPQTQKTGPTTNETTNLKQGCINAAIRGIKLDIERCQKWLEIPEEELTEGAEPREKIKSRLNQLKADLEKYENIQLEDYELPEKREVIGFMNQPCTENTMLQAEVMSRSGPFYHIVGINRGDYTVIKSKTKYRMTIYLVYPRYYPFPNYYIYIADYEQIQ